MCFRDGMAPYGTVNPIAIFLGGHSFTKKRSIVLPSVFLQVVALVRFSMVKGNKILVRNSV